MISKSLKQKSRVLDDVLQNVQERFGYLENDPVLKGAAVLDPDIWPKDEMEMINGKKSCQSSLKWEKFGRSVCINL